MYPTPSHLTLVYYSYASHKVSISAKYKGDISRDYASMELEVLHIERAARPDYVARE